MLLRLRRHTCHGLKHLTLMIAVTLFLIYLLYTWKSVSEIVPDTLAEQETPQRQVEYGVDTMTIKVQPGEDTLKDYYQMLATDKSYGTEKLSNLPMKMNPKNTVSGKKLKDVKKKSAKKYQELIKESRAGQEPTPGIAKTASVVVDEAWVQALRARTNSTGIQKKANLHWTIRKAGLYSSRLFSPPPGEIPKQRFPQAIIFGVGKCGTRALLEFLRMHPQMVPASSEIHFFDRDENFAKGYNWYLDQMPLSYSNQITMEKSPSYIWSERAVTEIHKLNKTMKLIVIMKDPVVRLVAMKSRNDPGFARLNSLSKLGEHAGTVHDGEYVRFLKIWLQTFSASQIHVIEGSEFIKNPAAEVMRVESFLGLPNMITEKNFYYNATKGFYCMRPLHLKQVVCLGNNKGRAHPVLNPQVEKVLYDHFRPFNEELFRILGRRFPWYPANRSETSTVSSAKKEVPIQRTELSPGIMKKKDSSTTKSKPLLTKSLMKNSLINNPKNQTKQDTPIGITYLRQKSMTSKDTTVNDTTVNQPEPNLQNTIIKDALTNIPVESQAKFRPTGSSEGKDTINFQEFIPTDEPEQSADTNTKNEATSH